MKKQTVFITGGTGFIGSALAKRLLREGNRVKVFDNNFRGSTSNLPNRNELLEIVQGDICDEEQVIEASLGCDTIFHLAFINGTKHFYDIPHLVLDVGMRGALNTVKASKVNNCKKYILASSSEVYQQPTAIPTKENERMIIPDPKNPRFSYSGGKMISELLTLHSFTNSEIKNVVFRPHNVFGPNMGFEHVIPEIMEKVYINTKGFTTSSCSISILGNGKESRAFCYIDDAIDQIVKIYHEGSAGEIYHVGVESERTINSLIEEIAQVLDIKISINAGKVMEGATPRRCPCINKTIDLGYVPVDNFSSGISNTVNWYKEFLMNKKNF